MRDETRQPLKWYGTSIDVDDERSRAREFERLAQRLKITMESITDGFLAVDCNWRFTFLNDQAERIIRQRREDKGQATQKKLDDMGSVANSARLECGF